MCVYAIAHIRLLEVIKNKMKTFTINKNNRKKGFIFKTPLSSIRIETITFQDYGTLDLLNLTANTKIKITLRETIYNGESITDPRTIDSYLNLQVEPNQKQPSFQIGKVISTVTFKVGSNPKEQFYSELEIELEDNNNDCSLIFEYELSDMEKK